jgi:hypothetical protein
VNLLWSVTAAVDLYGSGLGQAIYLYWHFIF